MKTRTVFCAIVAAALMLGCTPSATVSTGPGALRTKTCPAAVCDAIVTVDDSTTPPTISMYYDVVKMKRGSRNPQINWVLDAPDGYEFRADSIKPHVGAATGGKQTTSQAQWTSQIQFLNVQPTRFRVKNKNDDRVTLYYDVTAYEAATGRSWTLDPAIMNDP